MPEFLTSDNSPTLWRGYMPKPAPDGHKYSRGHAVVFGGAKLTGAARLAAEACARMGAGATTLISPVEAADVYRRTLPAHIMVEEFSDIESHIKDARRNALVIGPGGGSYGAAVLREMVTESLNWDKRLVVDADAITAFKDNREELFGACPDKCMVMTPHEGEFTALFPDVEGGRLSRAQTAAGMINGVMVLKGAETVIAAPGHTSVINTHASPYLASAGTGDVLAGMIAGLLAQGMEAFYAACAAVWMHGEAGQQLGQGLVASDILDVLPEILKKTCKT